MVKKGEFALCPCVEMDIIFAFEANVGSSNLSRGTKQSSIFGFLLYIKGNIIIVMKKLFVILALFLILSPTMTLAADSIVNCGTTGNADGEDGRCKFSDLQNLPVRVINWIATYIIVPLAIILIVIGGLVILFSAGNPNMVSLGKKIIFTTLIGALLAYGAKMIINAILSALGGQTI